MTGNTDKDYLQAMYEALSEQLTHPPKPMDPALSRRLHTALYKLEDELDGVPHYHNQVTLAVLIGLAALVLAITLTMTLLK